MHGPAANALTVILWGFAALFLFNAASAWLKAGAESEKPSERPTLSVSHVRAAAVRSALAMIALGIAAIWLACLSFPWSIF